MVKIKQARGSAIGDTALEATNVDIPATNIERLVQFAKSKRIDLTVVGPEASLVAGVVDAFQAVGLRIFGPMLAKGPRVRKAGLPD